MTAKIKDRPAATATATRRGPASTIWQKYWRHTRAIEDGWLAGKISGLIAQGVEDSARLFGALNCRLRLRPAAQCVDTIRKKNNRFAAIDLLQPVENKIDGIVEPRSPAGACPSDCLPKFEPITGKVALDTLPHGKRNDHHPIFTSQLIDKGNRRLLDIVEMETGAAGGIEHQDNAERNIDRMEGVDPLLDIILIKPKIAFLKVRNKPSLSVSDRDRNRHERGIDPDGSLVVKADRSGIGQWPIVFGGIGRDGNWR